MTDQITIPTEEVKAFAYHILEKCKTRLLEEGFMPRACWAFTTADKVPENPAGGTEFHRLEHNVPAGTPLDQTNAIIVIDLHDTPSSLITMVTTIEPKVLPIIELLRAAGPKFGLDQSRADHHMARALMQVLDADAGDIVAKYLKTMLTRLEAYAIVHMSEVWTILESKKKRSELPRSLADAPESIEALAVMWQTADEPGEHISIPFFREGGEKGKGKITGFGEMKVGNNAEASGRLMNLLRKPAKVIKFERPAS